MKHVIVAMLCILAVGMAVASAPRADLLLTVGNATVERTLLFGVAPGAGAGLDPGAGEHELPPLPPAGAFDARFTLDHLGLAGLQGLASDYRSVDVTAASYRLRVQRSDEAPLVFTWVLPAGITARLRDPFGGGILDHPMEGTGSTTYGGRTLTEFAIDVQYRPAADDPSAGPAPGAPLTFGLGRNFPNPFNPATRLHFTLTETGPATLAIYDITGRLVETLVDATITAGAYEITWDASNMAGGVYLARLTGGGNVDVRRLLLLK